MRPEIEGDCLFGHSYSLPKRHSLVLGRWSSSSSRTDFQIIFFLTLRRRWKLPRLKAKMLPSVMYANVKSELDSICTAMPICGVEFSLFLFFCIPPSSRYTREKQKLWGKIKKELKHFLFQSHFIHFLLGW